MIEIAMHKSVLERLGLATLDDVKRYQGTLVKDQRGRRDILRIDTNDESGQPLTLFLKRIYRPYKKDGFRSLLKRGKVWSLARQEWHNMQALNRHGFPTAELVAFGEEVGPFWERFSFILTKAAPTSGTVEDFLASREEPDKRRSVLRSLARQLREMHDAGMASPDCFARHFFVRMEGDVARFWLIDMARLDVRRPMTLKLRARDLAALHASVPMRFASSGERMRFFRDYGGGTLRHDLLVRVMDRTRELLKRSKFQGFLDRVQAAKA
jgi:hypothetical protein